MNMYGKGKEAKAKKLHSQVIRTLGYCEAYDYKPKRLKVNCGGMDYSKLQAAHIISRKYNATVTDLRNAFCLCAAHHAHFTDHPKEFASFIDRHLKPSLYTELYQKASKGQKGTDSFWQDRIDFLTDVLARINEEEMTLTEARLYEE